MKILRRILPSFVQLQRRLISSNRMFVRQFGLKIDSSPSARDVNRFYFVGYCVQSKIIGTIGKLIIDT